MGKIARPPYDSQLDIAGIDIGKPHLEFRNQHFDTFADSNLNAGKSGFMVVIEFELDPYMDIARLNQTNSIETVEMCDEWEAIAISVESLKAVSHEKPIEVLQGSIVFKINEELKRFAIPPQKLADGYIHIFLGTNAPSAPSKK